MMHFAIDASGTVSGRFEPIEIDLLRLATTQLADLLDDAAGDTLAAGTDPALRRLLPDAYRDDPEAAAEFRRFTSGDLLGRKVSNARTLLATLGDASGPVGADARDEPPVRTDARDEPPGGADGRVTEDLPLVAITLDGAAVQSWLRTLTDLRLTLAERLRISPDGVQHLEGEEALFLRELYEWLGMVQESLVYTIDR